MPFGSMSATTRRSHLCKLLWAASGSPMPTCFTAKIQSASEPRPCLSRRPSTATVPSKPGSMAAAGAGHANRLRPAPIRTTLLLNRTGTGGSQIKIEQVREIEQQIVYRPLVGERKICLIDDADRLTVSAANALLKTLEEPPDHSLFLLMIQADPPRCPSYPFAMPVSPLCDAGLMWRRLSFSSARYRRQMPDCLR